MAEHEDERIDEDEAPPSLGARAAMIAATAAIMVVVGVAFAHVALPRVASGEAAPKGHYGGPCWACHWVTSDVEGAK